MERAPGLRLGRGLALGLALGGVAVPAAALEWSEVARVGQIVPGMDPPVEIDELGAFVVLPEGRVLLSASEAHVRAGLLLRWSAAKGLERLIATGDTIGAEDPLAVFSIGVLGVGDSGLAALEFRTTGIGCGDVHSVALLDLDEQVSLAHRCTDLAALLPGGGGGASGPRSLGIDAQGRMALELWDPESFIFVPGDGGQLHLLPLRSGMPAPGELDSTVSGFTASWSAAAGLGIHAEIEAPPGASPGAGRGVYRWDPVSGFATIARLEWATDEFVDIKEFQGDSAGFLSWLACCGGPANGRALFQSVSGAPAEALLAEGDPVPGGPPGAVVTGIWALVTGPPGRVAVQISYDLDGEKVFGLVGSDDAGQLGLRLSEGQGVPGRPGWTYGQPVPKAIAPDGAIGFLKSLLDPAPQTIGLSQFAVVYPDARIVPVLAEGDVVQGATAEPLTIVDLDRIAFAPDLGGVAVALFDDSPPPDDYAVLLAPVPEPEGAALAAAAGIAWLAARRKRRGRA